MRSPLSSWSLRSIPLGGYVFLVVFVLRLIVLVRLTESQFLLPAQGDMHFYNAWAQRIAGGEWTDYRAFYGLPLYAYLLAGLYTCFGYSPFVPGLVQAALEGATAAILLSIARHVFRAAPAAEKVGTALSSEPRGGLSFGTIVGLLAAAGWAAYLPAQSYSVILMPTAWLVFVFWWLVWQVVSRTSRPSLRWFVLVGVAVGFGAMAIATILFLIPLLLAALVLRWNGSNPAGAREWRSTAAAALLLIAGVFAGASPAWLHNYFVARDPVFLSAHSGVNLWIGNNPGANGYPHFPPGLRAGQQAMLKDSITGAEAAAGRPLKRSEVSAYWSAKAKAHIRGNPGAWLKLLGAKVTNFWNSFQYDDISVITSLREQGVTFPGFRFGIVAALGLAGIFSALRRFPASRWLLAAILLHMFSLLSVFVTERYRLAAMPGLIVFAAFAIADLWQSIACARYGRAAVYAVLVAAASLIVSVPRGNAELWALDPYNSGLQAFESGRLELADRKLRLAYAYVPENAELNFALGNLHLARAEQEKAKPFYARTLQLDPKHAGAFNNLGLIALHQEQWPIAASFFRRALEQEPEDAKTRYLLARALLESGDAPAARRELTRAREFRPDQPEFIQLEEEIRAREQPGS